MAEVAGHSLWSRLLVTGLFAAVASGCTGGTGSGEPAGAADPSAESSSPGHPGAPPSETPAARSGDLGQEDLPAPSALGGRWRYRIDKGSAEDGYLGSGEPAIARDPASVLAAITPLGCRPGELPMPESALEVTYARGRLPGVGLLLQFDDEDTAARFFARHADVLDQCSTDGGANVTIEQRTENRLVTTRMDDVGSYLAWAEGVGLRGDEVLLIAVADPSRAGLRSVSSALT